MADTIRAVLAGCGGISGVWMDPIGKMADVDVVGLMDISAEAAEKRKLDYGLPNAVTGTDLDKILSDLKPDVVLDCTIPEAHCNVTLTGLKHGCHVMGEKPLADSMDSARKMVAAAQEAGKIYSVMQNRRYQPEIRALRKLIEDGAMGDLTTLHCDFIVGAHFGGFRDRMKHVLLLDMAIHTFDAARYISGADPVAAYCKEWNPKGSWYDHDASAVVLFEMTDGIVYTYRGSWCAEGINTSWEADWHAIGSKGSCTWDGGGQFKALAPIKNEGFIPEKQEIPVVVDPGAKQGGHGGCLQEFFDCVRSGATPETIASDNIKSLAMVFGAIESAETGKRVEIKV